MVLTDQMFQFRIRESRWSFRWIFYAYRTWHVVLAFMLLTLAHDLPTDDDTSLEDHIFKMLRAAYSIYSHYKQYDDNNRDVGPGLPERSTENRLIASGLRARKPLSRLHLYPHHCRANHCSVCQVQREDGLVIGEGTSHIKTRETISSRKYSLTFTDANSGIML